MNIPKELKIGGVVYKISYPKNKKEMEGKDSNDGEFYYADGKTDIGKQWIKFAFEKGIGKEYKEFVFFHELTHLLFYWTGTGQWDNEREVQGFSAMLYQVLKENGLLT